MKFEEFYQKYFKHEKSDFYRLARVGMGRMINSIDPLHDRVHVENLLELADNFLIKHKKVKNKLDMEALFLAVCWHDTWKAQRSPKTIISIIYGQAAEGILASIMFKKEAKKYAVDKNIISKASYAIRKHNSLQFLKRKTLESKLLKDIDKLDSLNFNRFLYAQNKNFRFDKKRHLFLINLYISKISRNSYNFSWTKDLMMIRRKEFLDRFNKEVRNKS